MQKMGRGSALLLLLAFTGCQHALRPAIHTNWTTPGAPGLSADDKAMMHLSMRAARESFHAWYPGGKFPGVSMGLRAVKDNYAAGPVYYFYPTSRDYNQLDVRAYKLPVGWQLIWSAKYKNGDLVTKPDKHEEIVLHPETDPRGEISHD